MNNLGELRYAATAQGLLSRIVLADGRYSTPATGNRAHSK